MRIQYWLFMYYIAYISSAVKPLTFDELSEIVRVAQKNNSKNEITGLLLYQSGNILQYLEGSEEKVMESFQRISNDPRHHHVMNVLHGPIEQRLFDNWSLGFKDLEDISNAREYREFLGEKLSLDNLDNCGEKILKFIKTFARLNV